MIDGVLRPSGGAQRATHSTCGESLADSRQAPCALIIRGSPQVVQPAILECLTPWPCPQRGLPVKDIAMVFSGDRAGFMVARKRG